MDKCQYGKEIIVHKHMTQIIGFGNQFHLMGQVFGIFVVEDKATTALNWYIDNN